MPARRPISGEVMSQALLKGTEDFDAGTANEYRNTAEVSASDQYDSDSSPDSTPDSDAPVEEDEDEASTTPQEADLSLSKSVDEASPNVGDTVTFMITVSNACPSDASRVGVDD